MILYNPTNFSIPNDTLSKYSFFISELYTPSLRIFDVSTIEFAMPIIASFKSSTSDPNHPLLLFKYSNTGANAVIALPTPSDHSTLGAFSLLNNPLVPLNLKAEDIIPLVMVLIAFLKSSTLTPLFHHPLFLTSISYIGVNAPRALLTPSAQATGGPFSNDVLAPLK